MGKATTPMKRAAIFNPYWDTLGGGERYLATIIIAYLHYGYRPTIIWPDKDLPAKILERFSLDLSGVEVDPELWQSFKLSSILDKLRLSSRFDSFFWLSDGSIPILGSKNNLLHFQVPFSHKVSLIDRLKIKKFNHILVNSEFTKSVVDKSYGCTSGVLYPPVTMMPSAKKENLILSVGRFDNFLHSKRQDILIETFKKIRLSGWKLVLAGGSLNSDNNVDLLRRQISNFNIELMINPKFSKIKTLYSQAKIYWHAAGYGANLEKNPEKAEHFGIVTVEAMSAGAVPIVFAGGGQLEIIQDGYNGFLWQTPEELITKTRSLIGNTENNKKINIQAIKTAAQFSQERFIHEFCQYLG